jgi:prefoldin subunit 5
MNDKREFKINLDAAPEEDFKISPPKKRPGKSSVRYTPSLAVLFAFMALGTSLVWMYYHFSTRLDDINMEGSSGIASLSSEFTANLSGMSEQLTEQKQATQQLLTDLENQVAKLKSSVSSLKTGKADIKDIKDVDAAVSGVKKTITPLQGSLAQMEGQLKEISRKTESVANSLQQIENSTSKNAADIRNLKENAISKSYVDQQIEKERAFQQKQLSVSSESLLKDIASLETKISNMKQRLVAVESQLSKKSAIPNKIPSSTNRKPAGNLSTPKDGEILEQDL